MRPSSHSDNFIKRHFNQRGKDMKVETPKYKRVLIKLSGEALCKGSEGIYNYKLVIS